MLRAAGYRLLTRVKLVKTNLAGVFSRVRKNLHNVVVTLRPLKVGSMCLALLLFDNLPRMFRNKVIANHT
jgi:hypothetical protein